MTGVWARIAADLDRFDRLARVAVVATRGSTPREIGAALVLRPDAAFFGTIGGGALEWRALDRARRVLAAGDRTVVFDEVVLGPDLGQCCGGRVTLAIEILDRADRAIVGDLAAAEAAGVFTTIAEPVDGRWRRRILGPGEIPGALGLGADGRLVERFGDDRRSLLLFGAGHVGRALILALAPLPFRVDWIDGRDDAFPAAMPGNVRAIRAADPVPAIAAAPAGAFVLAMTHDHALDFAVVDAALRRDDLPHVGVIGSASKRARFSSRLLESGHASDAIRRMVCPIGALGPKSKAPAVVAASVAVELLVADEMARFALVARRHRVEVEREEKV